MRLLLVRHGETAWNAGHRLQGSEDIPLSESGRGQGRLLAPLVAAQRPTRCISSPLSRATATAALLGFHDPELDERWQEAHLGDWTGLSSAELGRRGDGAYKSWRAGVFTPPGAETFEALTDRVVSAVEQLLPNDRTVLVVTHGGPIRALCQAFVGLQANALVPVDPASLTIIDFTDRARLRAYGATTSGLSEDPPD
ncbi:histidine phosphatase family protein [Leifsonella bigeumensis]